MAIRSDADDLKHFERLKPLAERFRTGSLKADGVSQICLKAAFSKCFEFNILARDCDHAPNSFFILPTLRGICEELIVLGYLKTWPQATSDELLKLQMDEDVVLGSKYQAAFFKEVRPQQTVLSLKDADGQRSEIRQKLRAIWENNGWPPLPKKKSMPSVEEIARKTGQAHHACLYDYLYRLTSGTVHFSVRSLVRSGWGPSTDPSSPFTFSPTAKVFEKYFVEFARTYGAYLFVAFCETFDDSLKPSEAEKAAIKSLREDLLRQQRWPEIVTHEEMNRQPPSETITRILAGAAQARSKTKLLD